MQCPVCKDVTLVISERQGIEIDYCPQCRGVWLDRGELDKIIDRTFQQNEHEQEHFHEHRDYDDKKYHGYKRKKRGFLGELFDFD
ncbi:MAG: zf-TFIIB domain-containing protein [Candidatus Jettenia sp.]|nr:MAG: zf-TFIIB domain-containing protein [Candidatus Jettenia sp.]